MDLVLAQEELFQGIHCDLWMDNNKNPYMTLEQMFKALEYKSKKGVEQLVERNPYLKQKDFSVLKKVPLKLGGTQEMRLFTRDGIMEVTFLSPKPKAIVFRAWARKVLNAFIDGQLIWKEQREQIKETNKTLSEAIKEAGYTKSYHHSNFYNLIYQTAIGFTAVSLRKARNAKPKAKAVDYMSTEEIHACKEREKEVITLLGLGLTRDEMKELFERKGVLYQTTLQLPVKEKEIAK
ncbi:hypothetical protein PKB71_001605 [Enterococcus faecalis]|nr:hypothetical protein [Enterococcus faecalis]